MKVIILQKAGIMNFPNSLLLPLLIMLAIVADLTDPTCEFEHVMKHCALCLRKILLKLKSIQNVMVAFVYGTPLHLVFFEKREA